MILEIITEYMAEKHGLGEFCARAMLLEHLIKI